MLFSWVVISAWNSLLFLTILKVVCLLKIYLFFSTVLKCHSLNSFFFSPCIFKAQLYMCIKLHLESSKCPHAMWLPTLTECLLLRDTLLWLRIETNALHCPRGAYSLEKKLHGKTEGYTTHPNTYSCDFRFLKYNLLAKTGNLLKHYPVTLKCIWEKKKIWEFPGNPVRLGLFCVFTAEHLGLIPGWGTKILQVAWHS